jgi:hypothetical protein
LVALNRRACGTSELGPVRSVVRSAQAQVSAPGIDIVMTAELGFPCGATGRFEVSFLPEDTFTADVSVTGVDGELRVVNFMVPQNGYGMEVTSHGETWQEQVAIRPQHERPSATLRRGQVRRSSLSS